MDVFSCRSLSARMGYPLEHPGCELRMSRWTDKIGLHALDILVRHTTLNTLAWLHLLREGS